MIDEVPALILQEIAHSGQGKTYAALHRLLVGVREAFHAREACILSNEAEGGQLVASSERPSPRVRRRGTQGLGKNAGNDRPDTISAGIELNGRPVGQLQVIGARTKATNAQLAHFADAVAQIVAQGSDLGSAERAAEETRVLRDLSLQLGEHTELEPLLQSVVQSARRLFDADYASVALLGPDGTTRWVVMDGNRTDTFLNIAFEPGKGTAGRVVAARKPLVHEGIGKSPDLPFAEFPINAAEGGVSSLGAPLMHAGQPFGALILGSRTDRHWTKDEVELATALANTAAAATAQARSAAFERAQRAFLEHVIESFPGVFLVLGPPPGYKVKYMNSRLAGLLPEPFRSNSSPVGRTLDEMRGGPAQAGSEAGLDLLKRAYELGQPISYEQYEAPDRAGTVRYWNWSIVPVGEIDADEGRSLLVIAHDITDLTTERQRSQRAAAEARLRADELEAVINQMIDGVAICDNTGAPVRMNPAGAELLGQSLARASEQGFGHDGTALELLTSTGEAYAYDRLPTVRASGGELVVGEQIVVRRPNGEEAILSVSASPLLDNDGKVTGSVAVFHDVTHEKLIERLKDEFLSVVSHELRTPLSAIMGYSDLMLRGAHGTLGDRQARAVQAVRANAGRLLQLINDVLDVSKLDSGVVPVTIGPANANAAAARTAANMHVLAANAGLQITRDIPDDLWVLADENRLQQIFENLVGNAIKFTPSGGTITIEGQRSPLPPDSPDLTTPESRGVTVRADKARSAIISVRDTGTGLLQEELGRIWDRFYQVDGTVKRRSGGTGLGLTIVRGLLQLQGGQVWAQSEGRSKGSTFTFSLPLAPALSRPSESLPDKEERRLGRGRTSGQPSRGLVLVAEDDADQREIICDMLELEGLEVALARDGEEARTLAWRLRPAAIALDILLPRRNGWEVLSDLRSHPETKDIPVLVISVVDQQEYARKLGAEEYLLKPIDPTLLREAVGRLFSAGGKERQ